MAGERGLVALIPARGGSQRLPGKNIHPFFGHPLLAYTVAAARNSRLFERVIVSTDDPLTGRIAEWYGAEYLPRPAELATDTSGLVDVALHVLESLRAQGAAVDALCQLMPNCPLRRSADIVAHHNLFDRKQRDFQISVISYRGVHPQWALAADHLGKGSWFFGSKHLIPSQQLKETCCPTGAIWWVRTRSFIEQRAFYGEPFFLAPIDPNRGVDIDRRDELELAELLTHGLWRRDGACPLEPIAQEPFPQEAPHD